MMRRASILPLLAVAAGFVAGSGPTSVQGQEAIVRDRERGWVGISYDLQGVRDGRVQVVVTDVSAGSPAQQAGVVVGDQLVSINGHLARTNFDNVPLQIRPGDSVDVVVQREGRPHRLRIVAARRPTDVSLQSTVTVTVTADSMAERMYRAMDSLRLTLVTVGGDSILALSRRPGTTYEFRVRSDTLGQALVEGSVEPGWVSVGGVNPSREPVLDEIRAPFGFWVFRTEAHDSLRRAMEAFNQGWRELRVREADRLEPYTDPAGRLHLARAEAELSDLRTVLKSYAERSVALRAAIDRAAQEAARPRSGYVVTRTEPYEPGDETAPARDERFGPLTPYALGQNRVAGAEIVDLQPELAAYFEVEGGVLVVDVLPGTPMALGGIEPGDVITHLDRVTIRSLPELRLGLSRAGDSLPLTVVRKGDRIQLLLHR